MRLAAGTSVGPYEILGVLAEGGMGEVYRARDSRLGRTIALKTLRSATAADPDASRRLIAEARAASAVNHPNVAHIYDVGQSDDVTWIAMELVEGVSVAERLGHGALEVEEILRIGSDIAAALGEAHRRGVTHRDIKPANVILTPAGQVKVLDFGLATLEEPLTPDASTIAATMPGVGVGIVLGTVHYMSPEQALGRRVTAATDIFSLGTLLYHISTGQLPFPGDTVTEILDGIIHHDPPPLTQHRPELPLELQRIVKRCLEKNPAHRYNDPLEVARALGELARSGTVTGEKVSIAVLPFDDLSPGKDNEYFSDGLTEEITTDLSNIGSLAVISRTSASRYKSSSKSIRAIAAELNVRYVLEGSVRKAGDQLRMTAQLIDAANDTHLWAGKYKGSLEEVFDIQEQVARQIVDALMLKLSPAEKVTLEKRSTLDAEAFDLYLRGRHQLVGATKRDLLEARSLFEAATTRDPRYAAAYAGLAEALAAYYEFYDRDEALLDRSIENALKALMYDANLPEAYTALALAYFNKGALEDSVTACRRAIDLDPDNYIGYWMLGRIDYITGRPLEGIEQLKKVIALNREFYPGYFILRMVCQSIGRDDIYRPFLTRLIDEVLPQYLARHPDDARARNCYGMELTQAGRRDEGLRQVEQAMQQAPNDPLILYATAGYYAQFGDRRFALEILEKAIDAGYTNFSYLEADPDLRPLHSDPRYAELLALRRRGPRHTPPGAG